MDLVINYDLSLDEKIHTHRIGRTARAGKGGLAISLYTQNDFDRVELIKDTFNESFVPLYYHHILDEKLNDSIKL